MKVITADHHRRIEIPGVPEPVSRPVNIDREQTGFEKLRSLRIYSFEAGSVIDGHAEEDEVLIVVLAGSAEITLIDENSGASPQPFTLLAATESPGQLCAAYLPPQGAYRLTPRTKADVAYARATPSSGSPPTVFRSNGDPDRAGIALLWEETGYPRMLRARLTKVKAEQHDLAYTPMGPDDTSQEALIHVRTSPEERSITITRAGKASTSLPSWDTMCVSPGDQPGIHIAKGTSALILVIWAE